MSAISRRSFLRRSAVAAAACTVVPGWFLEYRQSMAKVAPKLGANDRPAIALVGCGGQGRYDTSLAAKYGEVVALCDVDSSHTAEALKAWPKAQVYSDFRKLLERDDLHAIINGTPDHWHTLINIAAMRAGKDVYSEKPLTLTIDEGRRLVKVANETGRILQTGSQQRSDAKFHLACELVRNGRLGKLTEVLVNLPAGPKRGPFKPSPVPPELDWDFWQGQIAATEYIKEKCHGSFRYWYDYSGGTMTDWGAHHNDIALWGSDMERTGPVRIEGKPRGEMVAGGFTAASEYEVHYEYANGLKHICQSVIENGPDGSQLSKPAPGSFPHGVKFTGTKGWIFVTRGRIEASEPEILSEVLPASAKRIYASANHFENFFDCMRSRKPTICEPEIGHRSVSICHLGVLGIRTGRVLHWDPLKEQFEGDVDANKMVSRAMRKPYDYSMVS